MPGSVTTDGSWGVHQTLGLTCPETGSLFIPTATLYGEPQSGTYRVLASVEYGEELTLPAPFKLVLDTGIFPLSRGPQPSSAATTTSTGTDSTVETRTESRASPSATR